MQSIERIVFFGTPRFAVASLDALVAAGRRPVLVVSQPARPAGRGRRLLEPPVALRARQLGIAVEQPERVRAAEFLARARELAPDLMIVVAFGQIFPRELLELPRLGCLNVHASLLPRWRGAAPIAAAIAARDAATGISIQQMEEGLDTGPVFAERRTSVGESESVSQLTDRLAEIGAGLVVEVVAALERGSAISTPQNESLATWAPKLSGTRLLSLASSASALAAEVRAFHPEPGVALELGNERIKVLEAAPRECPAADPARVPGVVLRIGPTGLWLQTGQGALELLRVQRPGGRAISGRDLANGLRMKPGDLAV